MFMGGLLLFAAVIAWATALGMSPHGTSVAEGTEHVRGTVVSLLTKAALLTLLLTAISAWLLFPARRPKAPRRDYAILAVITLLIVTCIYELAWLQLAVLR
jgi:heme/copper-type cytochrome/quinol oxidase subunit 2